MSELSDTATQLATIAQQVAMQQLFVEKAQSDLAELHEELQNVTGKYRDLVTGAQDTGPQQPQQVYSGPSMKG